MPSLAMFGHLVLDWVSRGAQPRVPEQELVMDDPAQAAAFEAAGREDGLLAHTYLYHALQASALIAPGHHVLDLGSGPACQLAVLARLNPDAQFLGVDASPHMLALAEQTLARNALGNVALREGDMARLSSIPDGSVDMVMSTMSLHHLPDTTALASVFREIRRVLKPGGALYLVDFGRLKREATQRFFANDRAETQPAIFTQDYYRSLRAAFAADELRAAADLLGDGVRVERTFLVPFLVALCRGERRPLAAASRTAAVAAYDALNARQRNDLRDLARFFAHGGFPLSCPPWRS